MCQAQIEMVADNSARKWSLMLTEELEWTVAMFTGTVVECDSSK